MGVARLMKIWVFIKEELPPIGKEVKVKIINRDIYSNPMGLGDFLQGQFKDCINKAVLKNSNQWTVNIAVNNDNDIIDGGKFVDISLKQISHWEKEVDKKEMIENRWELLDL